MIPESFIQDLLHRVDIVDLIDAHVPLKKAGANWAACCPFHNEKSPSFTVSPQKQFYHCFGCGAHGTAIGFMMEYAGMGFVDAVKDLASRSGMQVPEQEGRRQVAHDGPRTTDLVDVMALSAQYFRDQLKSSPKAIDYLKQRGLTGEIAARFGMGYAPPNGLREAPLDYNDPRLVAAGMLKAGDDGRRYDYFRDRVMIPIINPKGEVIAFGGRIIGPGEPKYLNSPETPLFEKGRELFGLPQARSALRETDTAIVVEGYMDVIALAQHGVSNAVATLGTATTTVHVQKLLRQVDRIVFCFDGDSAGRKAAWRALENSLEALPEQKTIGFVFLPDAQDPDSFIREFGKEAFNRLVGQAMPLSDFLLRELGNHCDLSSAEGKAKLVAEAKPLLQKLQTPLLRLQLVKRLAETSGFSQQEVERLCELRSIAPPAPERAPRQSPAATFMRKLIRLILQKPALALRLPLDQLPKGSRESETLQRLVDAVRNADTAAPDYAVLLERLRGNDDDPLLKAAASDLMREPFAEDELESEFVGTLAKFARDAQTDEIETLKAKAQALGLNGLSSEEKTRYVALLSARSTNPGSAPDTPTRDELK
ncbi:MAG: DNA primase [Zoogloeaceae bacterium]|nr:DNA primase [Zoogloeaceae bacterium]